MADTTDSPVHTRQVVPSPNLDRVFVGIPDVYTAEQMARSNALSFLERSFIRFGNDDKLPPARALSEHLAAAQTIADFILTGRR